MSATDKLYFPPTGEETSYYLLITIAKGDGGGLRGRITIEAPRSLPAGAEQPPAYREREDELAAIVKEADEFAAVNGYPLRVAKPADVEFPGELGTYAERRIEG